MAKNSDTCLTGLLEIPILTSRSGPMKALVADLHHQAQEIDRARNAIARAWLRWREDHPDWKPPPMLDEHGKPKLTKRSEPMLISPMHPLRVARDGSPGEFEHSEDPAKARKVWKRKGDGAIGIGFETYLYHAGCAASPHIAAIVISSVCQEVLSNLKTNVQRHNHGHKYRWQAILAHDEQMPTFKNRTIPVPNNAACFIYAGLSAGGRKDKVAAFWGQSSAVLCFPLYSSDIGRSVNSPIVTLNVGVLSSGNRQLLKRVAAREWRWSDSRLICKKGKWQVQFTYQRPAESLGLNAARVAVLWPQFAQAQRPFLIESEIAGKKWFCGNGRWLATEFERLDARRLRIRGRYKVALTGVKGHGHARFEARLKPWARKTHDCQRHFSWQLIAEIVRFCKANDCGKVIYREPTLGIREYLWFGKNNIPYDWTTLATDLAHKLRFFGIELLIERANGQELRERFGGDRGSSGKNALKVPSSSGDADSAILLPARGAEEQVAREEAASESRRGRFRGEKTA